MDSITSDKINKLATSVYPSFAFLTGMQLNIFTLLDDCPLSIKEVADNQALEKGGTNKYAVLAVSIVRSLFTL